MSPDTEPPRAGGDTGAPRPAEDTNPTDKKPDSADPYAGLSLGELHRKLLEKHNEDTRQRLIRELKGEAAPRRWRSCAPTWRSCFRSWPRTAFPATAST